MNLRTRLSVLLFVLVLAHAPITPAAAVEVEPVYEGRTLKEWVRDLKSPDLVARINAVSSLLKFGKAAAPAVPALMEAMGDSEPAVRRGIIVVLGQMGDKARPAMPLLMDALKDEDASCRGFANQTLAKIGKAVVPSLIAGLKNASLFVRAGSARALVNLGGLSATQLEAKEIRQAVPLLKRLLPEEALEVRFAGAYALSYFDKRAKEAVPVLIEGLPHWWG